MREQIDLTKFEIHPSKRLPADGPTSSGGISTDGKTVDPARPECIVKWIVDDAGRTRYFIKHCTTGHRSPAFFNPQADDSDLLNQTNSSTGRPKYEFRAVGFEVFEYFLNFLKSGNIAFLRNAERCG